MWREGFGWNRIFWPNVIIRITGVLFTSKGKKQVIKKTVNNKQKTAYKLTPSDGDAPVYFVVVNDTTLRLVNDSLQEAVSDLNYDIIQVKK